MRARYFRNFRHAEDGQLLTEYLLLLILVLIAVAAFASLFAPAVIGPARTITKMWPIAPYL